jgi:hypothetical protein
MDEARREAVGRAGARMGKRRAGGQECGGRERGAQKRHQFSPLE